MVVAFTRVMDEDGKVEDALDAAIRVQVDGNEPLPREHVPIGNLDVEKSDLLRFFEIEP